MDALSDILDLVRLRSSVYFRRDFAGDWGMQMDRGAHASFHIMVRGRCFLEVPDAPDRSAWLYAGDIVVIPYGGRHALAAEPDCARIPGGSVIEAHARGTPIFHEGEVNTTLVCGHFEFDPRFRHPLLEALPDLIHLRQQQTADRDWLEAVVKAVIHETDSGRPGASVVVARLAEVLFVHVLRCHMSQETPAQGYLAALADPRLARALHAIHGDRTGALDVAGIARLAGMSRSAFSNRFRELTGTTPMAYATAWRLLRARQILLTSGSPLADVAEAVGYTSEAAFSRAFRRHYGLSPGAVRRAAAA